MAAREGLERGRGRPLTDEERKERHKRLYGTEEPPPRGTGLSKASSSSSSSLGKWILIGLIAYGVLKKK